MSEQRDKRTALAITVVALLVLVALALLLPLLTRSHAYPHAKRVRIKYIHPDDVSKLKVIQKSIELVASECNGSA